MELSCQSAGKNRTAGEGFGSNREPLRTYGRGSGSRPGPGPGRGSRRGRSGQMSPSSQDIAETIAAQMGLSCGSSFGGPEVLALEAGVSLMVVGSQKGIVASRRWTR